MIAKKCDRCGSLYEMYNMRSDPENPNGIMLANISHNQTYIGHSLMDLCPECMDLVLSVLKKPGDSK